MWIGDFQDLISIENLTRFGIGMIVNKCESTPIGILVIRKNNILRGLVSAL